MVRASSGHGSSARFLGSFLAAALAVGVPGPGLDAYASEPIAPAPVAAALSVDSDPAGATVYVNGQLAGQTPLTVSGVTPGDHRVRVVKDGYLENSRVVSVKPGQGESVQVKMTRDQGAAYALQQDPDTGGGGGSKKALWIALGAVAVGAGAYFLLKDSNEAPNAGTIGVNPTGGLAGATSFSFSANGASDPDGDSLTYSWNFGDGGTGSGQTATHTYTTAGSFNVALTVSDGDAQATANATVNARSLSGRWSGTIAAGSGLPTTLNFTQSGTSVTGTFTFDVQGVPADVKNGTVTGSVASPLNVTFSVRTPCCVPFTFTGTADADVNRLTGNVNGSGFTGQSWTLTRQ
jgi:PKD repeat protein